MKYKVMKVFESYHLPNDLADRIQEASNWSLANGTVLKWTVEGTDRFSQDIIDEIDDWLVKNGATVGEDVIIHYNW